MKDSFIVGGIVLVGLGILGSMYAYPQYNIYSSRLAGSAQLAQAQQNRQIAVNEAQAKLESAKLLAQAEVERAKGVAEANKIVSSGLGGPEGYLRYLWITEVAGNQHATVYIPTEAEMPILEARGKKP